MYTHTERIYNTKSAQTTLSRACLHACGVSHKIYPQAPWKSTTNGHASRGVNRHKCMQWRPVSGRVPPPHVHAMAAEFRGETWQADCCHHFGGFQHQGLCAYACLRAYVACGLCAHTSFTCVFSRVRVYVCHLKNLQLLCHDTHKTQVVDAYRSFISHHSYIRTYLYTYNTIQYNQYVHIRRRIHLSMLIYVHLPCDTSQPVGTLVQSVFGLMDKSRFEVLCFSLENNDNSDVRTCMFCNKEKTTQT